MDARASSTSVQVIQSQFIVPSSPIGKPRLGAYPKLLARFYEVLFFLFALSQTRGYHTPFPRDLNDEQTCRRRFLRNIAFICDFTKGGPSCTAVGLEDNELCYKFWMATNAGEGKTLPFLKQTLKLVASLNSPTMNDLDGSKEALLAKCVKFSRKRINGDWNCLRRAIQKTRDDMLSKWLMPLTSCKDHVELCRTAYRLTRSDSMILLNSEVRKDRPQNPSRRAQSPHADAKHYLGRLAHHIITHDELVRDAGTLAHILETYEVHAVDQVACPPRPARDSHTTLDGVLNRMFGQGDAEKSEVKRMLLETDRQRSYALFATFLDQYESSAPQVHAEIRVLEHFYKHRLAFVDQDRYVGCSKPSCTCCMLYFKHHPARMVMPESHQKLWPNWAPPLVGAYQKGDMDSDRQRNIMNKIIRDLRDDFIQEVLACSVPPDWHPDSLSGYSTARPGGDYNSRLLPSGSSEGCTVDHGADVKKNCRDKSKASPETTGEAAASKRSSSYKNTAKMATAESSRGTDTYIGGARLDA